MQIVLHVMIKLKSCKKMIGVVCVVYTSFIRVILFCLLFKHDFAILDYKCCNTVDKQEQKKKKTQNTNQQTA